MPKSLLDCLLIRQVKIKKVIRFFENHVEHIFRFVPESISSIAVQFSKAESLDLSWLNFLEAALEVPQLLFGHLVVMVMMMLILYWPPSPPRA